MPKPIPTLEKAVRLKPTSTAAHTNLAANLTRLGKIDLAEAQFKKAAELDPKSTTPTTISAKLTFARTACQSPTVSRAGTEINPASYDNGYDLALAYLLTNHHLADADAWSKAC